MGSMDYYHVIWLLGAALVLLSWLRHVPAWLGWVGFAAPTIIILFSNNLAFRFNSEMWWLYIGGLGLIAIAWLASLHRSFMWTGCFLSLIAAGMDWIDKSARLVLHEPVIVFTPGIDLALFIFVIHYINTEWFFRKLKSNPILITYNQRATDLLHLSESLAKRDKPGRFEKREEILFCGAMNNMLRLFESLGTYFLLSSLIYVFAFFIAATNFYASYLQFSFLVFNTNWFVAFLIDFVVLGILVYYPLEKRHKIRILK